MRDASPLIIPMTDTTVNSDVLQKAIAAVVQKDWNHGKLPDADHWADALNTEWGFTADGSTSFGVKADHLTQHVLTETDTPSLFQPKAAVSTSKRAPSVRREETAA